MATEKQKAANRVNAQHSTGPTSEAGSLQSAINNFRHGLAVNTHEHFGILPTEKKEEFDNLHANLNREYAPKNETEKILIRHMAQHDWLRARALRLQADCLMYGIKSVEAEKFKLFQRYHADHDRGFHRALNALLSIRKQERNIEIGFESRSLKQRAEDRALETQKLRRDIHEWEKEVSQAKKTPAPAPSAPPADQKMAA